MFVPVEKLLRALRNERKQKQTTLHFVRAGYVHPKGMTDEEAIRKLLPQIAEYDSAIGYVESLPKGSCIDVDLSVAQSLFGDEVIENVHNTSNDDLGRSE